MTPTSRPSRAPFAPATVPITKAPLRAAMPMRVARLLAVISRPDWRATSSRWRPTKPRASTSGSLVLLWNRSRAASASCSVPRRRAIDWARASRRDARVQYMKLPASSAPTKMTVIRMPSAAGFTAPPP